MPTNLQLNRLDCLKRIGASTPPVTTYRYFRITVDTNFGFTNSRITEAYILSGVTEYPTVAMTTDVLPVPLVASASTAGAPAFQAFDRTVATSWATFGAVTGWVQIDLGAGNEITPTGLRLGMAASNTRNANTGKLQASNDGAAWTDILSYDRGILGDAVLDQTFNVV